MVLQLVIAFIMATLLNIKGLTLRNVYRTLLIFPWAMPGYVSILLWKTGMFNSQFGLLNQWMIRLGMEPVRWLGSDVIAFISCTTVNLWLALPFMITIIDGATWLERTRYITGPMIRAIIAPSVMITTFTTFKQFDVIYLLTQQVGSKTGANIHTILTYAYEKAFITNNYGYSSAISILIFGMLLVFSLVTNGRKEESR